MKVPKKLKCPYCKTTFLLKSDLDIHIKNFHKEDKSDD